MLKHLVIPARLKSTRLPNKPLLKIHGKPMILWVIDRANAVKSSGIADDIFVATDDDSIAQLCQDYGANVHRWSKSSKMPTRKPCILAERQFLAIAIQHC